MTATAVLFGSFAILLLLSVPIGIAIGLATLVTIFYSGSMPLEFLAKELVTSVDSFPLMAVPFFILAGEIMGKGGISQRLFGVAGALVGNKTGGFAIATIITCMFFAAISGSGPATVAAIGGVMIPAMVQQGYDRRFATATVAAAGSIGIIIPPSIPMVMFGVTASVSIGDLFISGIIPGILVGVAMMIWAWYYSKKMGYKGLDEKTSLKNIGKAIWDAKWALLIPIIILGGIYGGIFTPTEAAVIAVVYGLFVAVVIYRELPLKELPKVIYDSALTTSTVLIIVGAANAFGRLLTLEQIPNKIANGLINISDNPIVIILLITALLLVVGMFMDPLAAIIILTPILLPIVVQVGYDPVHFGVLMIINLAIGYFTPPVGVNLFVGSSISGVSMGPLSKAVLPYIGTMLIVLLLVTFLPQIVLLFV
ncbi:TRAP transporter large permease [Niallia endozanthoxylica]|uniref:TRAP transporter large permease n=1 Tax=Niallia endozanthoxylica TaxID=2036016 RepID=A0A5J5HID7_9BACI|nr:TRAP transporter large permease [Niallia endozanthoxylica]KAA9019523.1 TRAP transporter large permease [Niallia endozanthoxylica]